MPDEIATGRLTAEPQHFRFVDSLRGLAIMAVIMVHSVQAVPITNSRVLVFASNGQYGVQLFFVVSAFTLFSSLRSRSNSDRKPLAAFYVRRIFRIGPLFWIAALFYAHQRGGGVDKFAPNGIGTLHLLTTMTFLHGWYPTTINSVVPGGWSIAAEFMFYCCIPLLFRKVRSLDSALRLAVASLLIWNLLQPMLIAILDRYFPASLHQLIGDFAYFSFPSQFPVFCLGIVLYFITDGLKSNVSPGTMLGIAVAVLWRLPAHVEFAGAFVLLAVCLRKKPFELLVNGLTRFIGKVSYSAYIWHFWLLSRTAPWLVPRVHMHSLSPTLNGDIQFAVLYLCILAMALPVATASFYAIELPGQWVGKRLITALGWGRDRLPLQACQS